MSAATVSVVIPTLNEGDNLADTVGYVLANSGPPLAEIVIVDDGSDDGSPERAVADHGDGRVRIVLGGDLGVAGARNAGAAAARGECIVFLDGHCFVPRGWLAPLVAPLASERVGLVGPAFTNTQDTRMKACGITWREPTLENVWLPRPPGVSPVPFHIGACQAVRADAFRAVGGYDPGMTRWGSEDIELCLRLWLLGYEVLAQPASLVYHYFRKRRPYEVEMPLILYNKLRMALLHLDRERLARVVERLVRAPAIAPALARAYTDDTLARRAALLATRQHDMDWFCERFAIPI